eukprot:Em0020g413a
MFSSPPDMLGSILCWVLYSGGGLLLLVTTAFLLFSLYVAYIHWKYSHIPSPKRNSFFLGHIQDLQALSKQTGNEFEPLATAITKWAEQVGDLFVVFMVFNPVVISCNPDDVKRVASDETVDKSAFSMKRIGTVFGRRFVGQGLFSILDYKSWKPRRKLYDSSFKRSSLKDLLVKFNECGDAFLERLKPHADGKTEVSMKEAFHETALDVISKLLHPRETETFREAVTAMRTIGRDCIEKRIKAVTSGEEVPNDILTQILQTSSGCGYLRCSEFHL